MKVKYLVVEVSMGALMVYPTQNKPRNSKTVTMADLTMECLLTENLTKTSRFAVEIPGQPEVVIVD